jgi:hypothetical protein
MKALGRYDTETQMFVEEEAELSVSVLLFWRTLVEAGKLDDDITGGE